MPQPQPKKKASGDIALLRGYCEAILDGRHLDEIGLRKIYSEYKKLVAKTKDPDYYTVLGMTACLLNKKAEAIKYHEASINMGGEVAEYLHNYSVSLMLLKELEKAMKYCKKTIEKDPIPLTYHLGVVNILEMQGKIEEAINYTEKLLKGNYKDNEALQNYHEDLLHYDEYLEAQKIANDPTTKYIPTEEVMAHLEV